MLMLKYLVSAKEMSVAEDGVVVLKSEVGEELALCAADKEMCGLKCKVRGGRSGRGAAAAHVAQRQARSCKQGPGPGAKAKAQAQLPRRFGWSDRLLSSGRRDGA